MRKLRPTVLLFCALSALCRTAVAQPKPHRPAWPMSFSCVGQMLVFSSVKTPTAPVQALLVLDAQAGQVRWAQQFGTLVDHPDTDRVRLDFSEGDERTHFTFQREALREMAAGSRLQIRGLYEDGFEFVDGYHTRSIEVVDCGVYNG